MTFRPQGGATQGSLSHPERNTSLIVTRLTHNKCDPKFKIPQFYAAAYNRRRNYLLIPEILIILTAKY